MTVVRLWAEGGSFQFRPGRGRSIPQSRPAIPDGASQPAAMISWPVQRSRSARLRTPAEAAARSSHRPRRCPSHCHRRPHWAWREHWEFWRQGFQCRTAVAPLRSWLPPGQPGLASTQAASLAGAATGSAWSAVVPGAAAPTGFEAQQAGPPFYPATHQAHPRPNVQGEAARAVSRPCRSSRR